jgi:hypothetical protein
VRSKKEAGFPRRSLLSHQSGSHVTCLNQLFLNDTLYRREAGKY